MHEEEQLQRLDRSRRRWRAWAPASLVGHVLTLLLVVFLLHRGVQREEEARTRERELEGVNGALTMELEELYKKSRWWIAEEFRRAKKEKQLPLP